MSFFNNIAAIHKDHTRVILLNDFLASKYSLQERACTLFLRIDEDF